MSLTIVATDMLRRSVEAASQGRNTIVYTAKGQPCLMYVLRKFTLESIDAGLGTGTHPAFVVDGVEKDEILIGIYQGHESNGELVSWAGQPIRRFITHDQGVTLARANGPGWHLMTNAEWAAIGLRCWADGWQPRGNTNGGRSSDDTSEYGVDADGNPLPNGGGTWILPGSGPVTWRHDRTAFGIADLNGNVWEWSPGVRLNDGEINVIEDNDAALDAIDHGVGSAAWRAIDGATGNLVNPGSAGTVHYATSGTADYTLVLSLFGSFANMTNPGGTPVAAAAIERLKGLGLYPVAGSGLGNDVLFHSLSGERMAFRGGAWNNVSGSGVFAVSMGFGRSDGGLSAVGVRPAFVP